jgi:hypothetical protein
MAKKDSACSPFTPWRASKEIIQMTFELSHIMYDENGKQVSIVGGKSAEEIGLMYEQYVQGGLQAVYEQLGISVDK